MIHFILQQLRRQPGVVIPDEAGTAALAAAHATYGGERLYVPKLPKLQGAVRVSAEGCGTLTQAQIAQVTGKSIRTVRRIQRGR